MKNKEGPRDLSISQSIIISRMQSIDDAEQRIL